MNRKYIHILILLVIPLISLSIIGISLLPTKVLTEAREDIYKLKSSIYLDWEKIFINQGNDYGYDIGLDSMGNVYITGEEKNNTKGNAEVLIAKYNKSGDQIWKINRGNNFKDGGNSIVVDSSDNLYVAGYTQNTTDDNDILLLKYNLNGEYQWNRTWGGDEFVTARGITIDKYGDIYVVGDIVYNVYNDQIVILKYNETGKLIWNKTWGNQNWVESASEIEVDSDGNFYIAGMREQSYGILLKFNNSGSLIWQRSWGGIFGFYDLVVDSNDNIYVTGGGSSENIHIRKYHKDGSIFWSRTYNSGNGDGGRTITLDKQGNVYIGGYIGYPSKQYPCILKYSNNGSFLWGKKYEYLINGVITGITIDSYSNLFTTGFFKGSLGDSDVFLTKYLPKPSSFQLSSDAESLDPDGCFNLIWTESLDANNYTIFQYDKPISTINNSLYRVIEGCTNHSYYFENMSQGIYYFIIIGFNSYGNCSSNCLKVVVQYPPEEFVLFENPENPENDGNINLTWSSSIGADNYTVYGDDNFINIIDGSQTKIVEGLNSTNFFIEDLQNGNYFYIIVAFNEVGQILSNCISFTVLRIPQVFNLTSDAENPDKNGKFELIWEDSEFADNYTVFKSLNYITVINETVQIEYQFTPPFYWPHYRFQISDCPTGTFYFKVFAFNQYGNTSSNCIKIIVKRLPEIEVYSPEDNDMFEESPPLFNIWVNQTNLHKMWYTLNLNNTKFFFSENETINYAAWNLLPDGFVTIRFSANTTDGYNNSNSIVLKKDINPPNISIISPIQNQFFSEIAPDFEVDISETFLDGMWYSLNGGKNITFKANSTIDSTEWNFLPNGSILITFYANDSFGHLSAESVLIRKDIISPIIEIISPLEGMSFENLAPNYTLVIDEPNIDSMWYSVNNDKNYSIIYLSGTIDQILWDSLPEGNITIGFYVRDAAGNIASQEIEIIKNLPKLNDYNISFGNHFVLAALIGIVSIILIRKRRIRVINID